MKKFRRYRAAGLFLIILLAGCGWKPEVAAVPLTAPWSELKLPVRENAVVWKCSANELRVVHKEDKLAVMKKYTDAFKAQGWTLGKFDPDTSSSYLVELQKGAEKLSLRVYDFDNTGVVLEKK